jgi:hypothetical protein
VRSWAREEAFLLALKELSSAVYERVDMELKSSKESIRAKLEEASEKALERIITLAQQEKNDHVALKAAQDILDRDGRISRTSTVNNTGTVAHTVIDPITLIHAVATAREQDIFERKKLGPVEDGTLPPTDATGGVGQGG